jgi:hypothetical protein
MVKALGLGLGCLCLSCNGLVIVLSCLVYGLYLAYCLVVFLAIVLCLLCDSFVMVLSFCFLVL